MGPARAGVPALRRLAALVVVAASLPASSVPASPGPSDPGGRDATERTPFALATERAPAPLAAASSAPTSVPAAPGAAAQVVFTRIPLDRGTHDGTMLRDGLLVLAPLPASGGYDDPFGRRGIAEEHGSWSSAPVPAGFGFDELIASWNATTPSGTWLSIELRASGSGRTTRWYTMAVWAADDETVRRASVRAQDDGDGRVAFDTFVRARGAVPLTSYELRVTLHRVAGSAETPAVSLLGAVASVAAERVVPSAFGGVARDLDVPLLSQEVHAGHFPDFAGGGEAWCSPTSTAMVLAYWHRGPTAAELAAFPGGAHAGGAVDHAARYAYDWSYRGTGNWPYNTAYAARYGLVGFVTRLRSLAEAERFIAAGIPLVASISGELPGFLFGRTSGHLLVIRGLSATGDVVTNDPAVLADARARTVYARADFERVWLGGSNGTVYVMRPADAPLPPRVAGLPANW